MTKAEAEKLTARINRDGYRLGELLLQAHDGKAWAALGYRSWSAYIGGEFSFSRATSYRLLAAEREPDALVQGSERLTTETDDPEESSNGQVVDAVDVDQRPLDTITPDAVLPPPAKKSGGARTTAPPPRTETPTGDAPASPSPAPLDPLERLPTIRQQTAAIVAAMLNLAPDDAGPVLTAEDATVVKGWAARTVRAWQMSLGIESAAEPARSPGRVIRPKDKRAKTDAVDPGPDPNNCTHPKERRKQLGYMTVCGLCSAKIAS